MFGNNDSMLLTKMSIDLIAFFNDFDNMETKISIY